jgi:hypothetical protein
MSKLPPISAPLDRRWREFRVQYLPLITFAICVVTTILLWSEFAVPQRRDASSNDPVESSLEPFYGEEGVVATVANVYLDTNSPPSTYSD